MKGERRWRDRDMGRWGDEEIDRILLPCYLVTPSPRLAHHSLPVI